MATKICWSGLCGVLVIFSQSGCSRAASWQQTYEGCKTLATAMAQDHSGLLKVPDCERLQQSCSADPNGSDCKSELANYSMK